MDHPQDAFDPNLELVVVLETSDRELAMAKGLLESAGIPLFVLGQIATLIQDIDPYLHKWVRLQVPRDREPEARSSSISQWLRTFRIPTPETAGAGGASAERYQPGCNAAAGGNTISVRGVPCQRLRFTVAQPVTGDRTERFETWSASFSSPIRMRSRTTWSGARATEQAQCRRWKRPSPGQFESQQPRYRHIRRRCDGPSLDNRDQRRKAGRGGSVSKGGGADVAYAGGGKQMSADWRREATQRFLTLNTDAIAMLRDLLHLRTTPDAQVITHFNQLYAKHKPAIIVPEGATSIQPARTSTSHPRSTRSGSPALVEGT